MSESYNAHMHRYLNLVFILLSIFILSGCKTITLDESFVFQPGQFGGNETEPRTSKLRYESVLLEPTDLVIDVWADNQKAKHIIRSDSFVKSTVIHDIIASGGEQLGITLVERSGASRPLVVHCGGNASDRYESGTLYAQKIIASADVLLFDYPGYGESTGRATAESLKLANQTIANFAKSNRKPDQSLILWGHSLGGFVCADMAGHFESVDGIVLETSATNAEDVSKAVIPWYAKAFIKTRVAESLQAYDVVETLKHVDAPILILGAAKDKTLPVELSQALADRLATSGHNVTYVEFPKGNHISVPIQDTYVATIEAFMAKIKAQKANRALFQISSLNP